MSNNNVIVNEELCLPYCLHSYRLRDNQCLNLISLDYGALGEDNQTLMSLSKIVFFFREVKPFLSEVVERLVRSSLQDSGGNEVDLEDPKNEIGEINVVFNIAYRQSPKYGKVYTVIDYCATSWTSFCESKSVESRTFRFHGGNYLEHSLGCFVPTENYDFSIDSMEMSLKRLFATNTKAALSKFESLVNRDAFKMVVNLPVDTVETLLSVSMARKLNKIGEENGDKIKQ